MLLTRVSYVGVFVDALVYVCKLLPLSCGYVQRYEGGAWLTSRRAVGDFSLRRAFCDSKSMARGWEAEAPRDGPNLYVRNIMH